MTALLPADARLLVLVGPAGSGKTTIAHRLVSAAPDRRAFSVSHTTRAQRPNERDGADYYFVSTDEFATLRRHDAFAECAEVHGQWYGTSHAEIRRLAGSGCVAVFDIDIQGAHNLYRAYPHATLLCFVLPPSWRVLVERLTARGTEGPDSLRRRLTTARHEFEIVALSAAPWHLVQNDDLASATAAVEGLIAAPSMPPDDLRANAHLAAFLRDATADARTA
jgi:guanylate kinase